MASISLGGKSCLITGASRGIGRAIATLLSEAGGNVAIGFHGDHRGASETQKTCGGSTIVVQGDVSKPEDCKRMVYAANDRFGSVDIIVNNAAISQRDSFSMSYEAWVTHWNRTLAVNLMSAVNIAFCAVELMKRTGGGKIINVSSRSAFRGETEFAAYAASKAAIVNFTRSLARSLAGENIRAYAVAPGFINTGMGMEEIASRGDAIRAEIPSGKIGTPDDVANVVLFLASDLSNYITGSTIDVNGGSYLH
jgi:NAD(P)-dependent dehydrogenase (short-subunit alcohol dehydrogenase family)